MSHKGCFIASIRTNSLRLTRTQVIALAISLLASVVWAALTRERTVSGDGVGYVVVLGVWMIEFVVLAVHMLIILVCMSVMLVSQQRPLTVAGFLVVTLLSLFPAVLFGYVMLLTAK